MTRATSRAGFTLIELMIAMLAGSIAVAGVYYLNGISSRMFGEQMRVAETQMALRSALEQIRRDFSRAGYLSTPNSSRLPDCTGSLGTTNVASSMVRSLALTKNGSLGDVNTLLGIPGTNPTRADSAVLTGNFATSDAYLSDPTVSTNTVLRFQADSEAFRRSFFKPAVGGAATFEAERFTSAFKAGRMLRVENEGRVFFRTISASSATSAATASVTLTDALPTCFDPTRWTAIAPVMRVRYALERDDQNTDLARLRSTTGAFGAARTILVRREVDAAGTVMADTARVVLDYAVEFAVEPIVWDGTNFNYALSDADRTAANDAPETIAAVLVTLSARSLDADPNLQTLGRTPFGDNAQLDGPLLTFRVIDPSAANVSLNARVRRARAEIFLQNQ